LILALDSCDYLRVDCIVATVQESSASSQSDVLCCTSNTVACSSITHEVSPTPIPNSFHTENRGSQNSVQGETFHLPRQPYNATDKKESFRNRSMEHGFPFPSAPFGCPETTERAAVIAPSLGQSTNPSVILNTLDSTSGTSMNIDGQQNEFEEDDWVPSTPPPAKRARRLF
jgi:hypothetical protein